MRTNERIHQFDRAPLLKSKPCNVDPIFQLGNLEAQRVAC